MYGYKSNRAPICALICTLALLSACGKSKAPTAAPPSAPVLKPEPAGSKPEADDHPEIPVRNPAPATPVKAPENPEMRDRLAAAKAAHDEVDKLAEKAAFNARKLLLDSGMVFLFVLDQSPGAQQAVVTRCRALAKGDATRETNCVNEAAVEGGKEGMRFERGGTAGEAWAWVSFGPAEAGEKVYLRAPVKVLQSPVHELRVQINGEPSGEQWDAMPAQAKAAMKAMVMTIEQIGPHTVVMSSPKKGKLVYRTVL